MVEHVHGFFVSCRELDTSRLNEILVLEFIIHVIKDRVLKTNLHWIYQYQINIIQNKSEVHNVQQQNSLLGTI